MCPQTEHMEGYNLGNLMAERMLGNPGYQDDIRALLRRKIIHQREKIPVGGIGNGKQKNHIRVFHNVQFV